MKKALSIILSLLMATSVLSAGATAFADGSQSATVYFSCCNKYFVVEPGELEVSADLSEKYAEQTGCTDSGSAPTILDTFIAASIEEYGENFYETAPFTASGGWITEAFESEGPFAYYQNGVSAYSFSQAVADGDCIEFCVYQDAVSYSDVYGYFNKKTITLSPKKPCTLTLMGTGYDEQYNFVDYNGGGVDIFIDGEKAGTTSKKGTVNVYFEECGTHIVSMTGSIAGKPTFLAWSVVNVAYLPAYISEEMVGGAEYMDSFFNGYKVSDAVKYLSLLKSGYDMSAYNKDFLDSVEDALYADIADNPIDDIGICGAVIQILDILDFDATNFRGVNVVEHFENLDLGTKTYNPYYYRPAIEAASPTFAKKLCDDLIADYYDMGSGLRYWGYSCDNTAYFLIAIAKYADDYPEYVEDAKAVLQTCTRENGAICNPEWVPDVNANSTALAMGAYAAIGEVETAFTYYKNLVEGFESKAGIFVAANYQTGELEDNALATGDALVALEYFYDAVYENDYEHPENVIKTRRVEPTYSKAGESIKYCAVCGDIIESTPIAKLVKNGWFKEGGKWYYYKNSVAQKGWLKDGGKWYYLNSSGVMTTGWQKVGGK